MDEEEKNIQYCERKNKIGEIRKLREVEKFNQKQVKRYCIYIYLDSKVETNRYIEYYSRKETHKLERERN